MKDLIERLRAQASAHRYMDEPDSAKLLDEAVAALEEKLSRTPEPEEVAVENSLNADTVLLDFMAKEAYHIIQLAGSWYSRKHHGAPWLRQPDLRTAIRTVMAAHEREVSPKASHAPSASPGWTHLHKVLPVLRMAANGLWGWPANSRCKYIDLHIDMRDGNCILYNRYHEVTSPEEFAHQSYSGAGWRWPEQATLSLHADIEADRRYLEQLAAHFDDSPVPEIKAHRQRLISIANKLV